MLPRHRELLHIIAATIAKLFRAHRAADETVTDGMGGYVLLR